MKEWYAVFEKAFFGYWLQAGLPSYTDSINQYIELRERGLPLMEWTTKETPISAGVSNAQLHSVYGFGGYISKITTDLLALDLSTSEKSADFCGRFNLGISLFDHISDELDGIHSITNLEVFAPLLPSSAALTPARKPAEILLTRLAKSVLKDLQALPDLSLLPSLQQLFEAEVFVSNHTLTTKSDPQQVEKALYMKSAAPFEIMTSYTCQISTKDNAGWLSMAHQLGQALGHCYWLIDDAKDIGSDLKALHWNWFFNLLAKEDKAAFNNALKKFSEEAFLEVFKKKQYAESVSQQAINALIQLLKNLPATEETKKTAAGFVGASLWQWWKY